MKTKIFLSSLLAVSLFMVSCKKELQPQESTPTDAVTATDAGGVPTPVNMSAPQQAPAAQQQLPQQTQQVQPQATTTAPGMNPPHGQPNHRCDIAVGAPLNSPPGQKPAAQPKASAPVQMQPQAQPQASAPAVATAPGMNPPHGQPNHRCDVAVGAPLPK